MFKISATMNEPIIEHTDTKKGLMKSIDIKGKKYVTVNERLIHFRSNHSGYGLISEIVELTDERVVMKATIVYGDGILAVGHAYEDKDSTFINKTSFIENCETSAWGRALANFGIGIEESVASADEVVTAIAQKDDLPWLNDKDFKNACYDMNREADNAKRAEMYASLKKTFRIAKRYSGQLSEIVNQRDIQV